VRVVVPRDRPAMLVDPGTNSMSNARKSIVNYWLPLLALADAVVVNAFTATTSTGCAGSAICRSGWPPASVVSPPPGPSV